MERVKKLWRPEPSYQAIEGGSVDDAPVADVRTKEGAFSWIEYSIFFLLGVSMLWAWNMFLAAGPYFQRRFESDPWIVNNFQAAELSVSTIANLGSMLLLTKLQANASYPKRIMASLFINIITFTLLALSTRYFVDVDAKGYFAFLVIMVFATSLATGLCQNGIFAFVSGFGQGRYTQGIMTGQAVAGVLPCIAQIVSVLSVKVNKPTPGHSPSGLPSVPGTAAFAYFMTATAISCVTLLAFTYLLRRQSLHNFKQHDEQHSDGEETGQLERRSVPLTLLLKKLRWLSAAVFLTFAVTMVFPVYTQRILSVRPVSKAPQYLQPPSFIPLAFLMWNVGDLVGRLLTAVPAISLTLRPRVVLLLALSRIVFIPLYHLCNINGHGAVIESDAFYLIVVQILFGISNGYLGSTCMIGAAEWVDSEEREAAGGFMGLSLVAGLTVGSLLSFFAASS